MPRHGMVHTVSKHKTTQGTTHTEHPRAHAAHTPCPATAGVIKNDISSKNIRLAVKFYIRVLFIMIKFILKIFFYSKWKD